MMFSTRRIRRKTGRQGDGETRKHQGQRLLLVSLSPCLQVYDALTLSCRRKILRLKRRNVWQVAKAVLVVQSIADHELVGNLEHHDVRRDRNLRTPDLAHEHG